jgi:hypothetical protein
VELRVWLADRVALRLDLGGEIPVNRVAYREIGPEGPSTVFSPWAFQPRGGIGFVVVAI